MPRTVGRFKSPFSWEPFSRSQIATYLQTVLVNVGLHGVPSERSCFHLCLLTVLFSASSSFLSLQTVRGNALASGTDGTGALCCDPEIVMQISGCWGFIFSPSSFPTPTPTCIPSLRRVIIMFTGTRKGAPEVCSLPRETAPIGREESSQMPCDCSPDP